MLFSSLTFLFLFFPIVCAAYLLARKEIRNYILLIASIIFYAWGEPRYLAIMILTILVNYIGANYISRSRNQLHRKLILAATIIANLSSLFYFKYFNFVMDNINAAFNANISVIDVVMPIGISFYTFQAMSYVIDVYRKEVSVQKDVYKLSLYITLFPQLVAGPIVKYHDVDEQINNRSITFDKVSYGVKRFIIGLSKKILLANTLGSLADKIFAQPLDTLDPFTAWVGALAYSLQLFYDFSGYSDMAIGLGSIFGFRFLENFNYPYISKSITEFWRRWHISLSTWFKEYLYIPLGGNRVSPHRTCINLFIVFLVTGLWHGASWNFIFWGIWHGMFIIFEKITGWHKQEGGLISSVSHHIYAMFAFILGWVLFRADNLTHATTYLKSMFGLNNWQEINSEMLYEMDNIKLLAFAVGILCSMPIFTRILDVPYAQKLKRGAINIWLGILFILSVASITASTYNPFIYFRF